MKFLFSVFFNKETPLKKANRNRASSCAELLLKNGGTE